MSNLQGNLQLRFLHSRSLILFVCSNSEMGISRRAGLFNLKYIWVRNFAKSAHSYMEITLPKYTVSKICHPCTVCSMSHVHMKHTVSQRIHKVPYNSSAGSIHTVLLENIILCVQRTSLKVYLGCRPSLCICTFSKDCPPYYNEINTVFSRYCMGVQYITTLSDSVILTICASVHTLFTRYCLRVSYMTVYTQNSHGIIWMSYITV